MSKKRAIVRLPRYERDLRRLVPDFERAEETIQGVEEIVSRMPDLGMVVRGYDSKSWAAWVMHFEKVSVQVVYRYSETSVVFISARSVPSS